MSDSPACWNCRYFDRDQNCDADGGFCRRFPPQSSNNGTNCILPGVDFMDWCGEFVPIAEEANA